VSASLSREWEKKRAKWWKERARRDFPPTPSPVTKMAPVNAFAALMQGAKKKANPQPDDDLPTASSSTSPSKKKQRTTSAGKDDLPTPVFKGSGLGAGPKHTNDPGQSCSPPPTSLPPMKLTTPSNRTQLTRPGSRSSKSSPSDFERSGTS
jgi:hypothetical protein